jgi:hypothetical protein
MATAAALSLLGAAIGLRLPARAPARLVAQALEV